MKKIRDEISALGWWNGLLYVASRALERLTNGRSRIVKYLFVAQPVPPHLLAPSTVASNLRTYRVRPDDPIVEAFPRPRQVIIQRFTDGAICFAAVKENVLAGFIWIKRDRYNEDEVRCLYVLEPRGMAAWDFDVWVAPEFRLTRTFARLWDAANGFLREQGYPWSVSRISAFNPASLASHRRLGLTHLQSGLFFLFGALQIAFFTCAPYLHVGLTGSQIPLLRLRVPDITPQWGETARTITGPLT